jgi:hypothetical protein
MLHKDGGAQASSDSAKWLDASEPTDACEAEAGAFSIWSTMSEPPQPEHHTGLRKPSPGRWGKAAIATTAIAAGAALVTLPFVMTAGPTKLHKVASNNKQAGATTVARDTARPTTLHKAASNNGPAAAATAARDTAGAAAWQGQDALHAVGASKCLSVPGV